MSHGILHQETNNADFVHLGVTEQAPRVALMMATLILPYLPSLASQGLTLLSFLPHLGSKIQLGRHLSEADELWVLHLVLLIPRLSSLP